MGGHVHELGGRHRDRCLRLLACRPRVAGALRHRGRAWRARGAGVSTMTARRIWLAIDIGLKLALISLLLTAVLYPHLPQFEGKAMGGRAVAYPLSVLIVPVF